MTKKEDIIDTLTANQHLRLKDSIQQAKAGKTMSNHEVKHKVKDWLANKILKSSDTRQNPAKKKNKYD